MTGGGTGWAGCPGGVAARAGTPLERLIFGAPLGCSSLEFPVLMVEKCRGGAQETRPLRMTRRAGCVGEEGHHRFKDRLGDISLESVGSEEVCILVVAHVACLKEQLRHSCEVEASKVISVLEAVRAVVVGDGHPCLQHCGLQEIGVLE